MSQCQCCGNLVQPTSGVTMYWLFGKKYVYNICYVCWAKPYLKALFLNQKGDLPDNLIKEFGGSLGYTKQEIKEVRIK